MVNIWMEGVPMLIGSFIPMSSLLSPFAFGHVLRVFLSLILLFTLS